MLVCSQHYGDYALFLTDEPGLELALDLDTQAVVQEGAHYGIVVETTEEVDAAIVRFESAGYAVDIEKEETCCYAVQNKVWATDPDGRRWETYHVVADVEVRDDEDACCGGGAPAGSSACCAQDAAAINAGEAGCGCASETHQHDAVVA